MSESKTLEGARYWWVIVALVIVELAGTYETVMIFSALPTLFKVFGEPTKVTWLVTSYLLVGAGFTLISSRLGDLIGRTQMLIAVLVVMAVGSALSASTDHLGVVIAGRAMQGVAAALIPLSMGIVRELFPPKRVPFGIGVITGSAGIGGGLGLLMGAVLIDNFHWHSIFICSALFSLFAIVVVFAIVPRSPVRRDALKGLDILGAVLLVPSMVGVTYAVSIIPKVGLFSTTTALLGGGSFLLLAAWVRHELRHPNPLIDVRLLARPQIAICNLIVALSGASIFQNSQVITVLAQQPAWTGVGLGLTATMAGFLKLPNNIAGLGGGLASAPIAARWGSGASVLTGAIFLSLGWGAFGLFHDNVPEVLVWLVVIGFGLMLFYSGISTTIVQVAPAGRASEAAGLMNAIRGAFGAIGSQVVVVSLTSSKVADARGGHGYGTPQAFDLTFLWITSCAVACIILALFLIKVGRPRKEPELAAGISPTLGKAAVT